MFAVYENTYDSRIPASGIVRPIVKQIKACASRLKAEKLAKQLQANKKDVKGVTTIYYATLA